MPGDDSKAAQPETTINAPPQPSAQQQKSWADVFHLPKPVRELFGKFPLITYAANDLPTRSPQRSGQHVLYVFTTADSVAQGAPSFNPTCLKWQTFLRISGIDFCTVASNNHASPSGSLPFLLPGSAPESHSKGSAGSAAPVPSSKIRRWVEDGKQEEKAHSAHNVREEIHLSLLDHRLRRAWLYLLYLDPSNVHIVDRLYVKPNSSNSFVNMVTASQLRRAAEDELRKSNQVAQVSTEEVLQEGADALTALSDLLGEGTWFFGAEQPGLFDCAVFAYTHLLLDRAMRWAQPPFEEAFERQGGNLRSHRQRLLRMYYKEEQ